MGSPNIIRVILRLLVSDRSSLIAENLALRQQLAVLGCSAKRPRLRQGDRIFWVWISRLWRGWRSALVVIQPGTCVPLPIEPVADGTSSPFATVLRMSRRT
jgi:hypothetical protein